MLALGCAFRPGCCRLPSALCFALRLPMPTDLELELRLRLVLRLALDGEAAMCPPKK